MNICPFSRSGKKSLLSNSRNPQGMEKTCNIRRSSFLFLRGRLTAKNCRLTMSGTSRNVQHLPASTSALRNLIQSPSKERSNMQQSRRKWFPYAILSLFALPLSAEAQTEKKLDGLPPVTHERLLKGTDDTSSWLMYGGSYQGWRF